MKKAIISLLRLIAFFFGLFIELGGGVGIR